MRTSRPGKATAAEAVLGGSRGFSLLELVVVLTLIVAATVLLAPSFRSGLKSLELEAAARDMVTRMKYARSEAVAKQRVFRILFQAEAESENAGYALTDDYELPIKSFELPSGVAVAPAQEVFEQEVFKVSFYPNGRSSGGSLLLRNDLGREIAIEVDPVTGLARARKPGEGEP